MAPTKSTPAKATPAAAPEPAPEEIHNDNLSTPQDAQEPAETEEEKPQKRSTKTAGTGDYLWCRGDSGPVFALVTAGTEGEAEVLLLRPDEVVKGRTVAVYDSAEDAEKGYEEGQPHVAWHI